MEIAPDYASLPELQRKPLRFIACWVTGTLPAPTQRPADAATVDPLSAALENGLCDPVVTILSEAEALAEAETHVAEADRGEYSTWLLSRTIDLAAQFPHNERIQYCVGKLLDLSGDRQAARLCWRRILDRFPHSFNILPEYFRAVMQECGAPVARQILESYERPCNARMDAEQAIGTARCRVILGEYDRARTLLDSIAEGRQFAGQIAIEKAQIMRMEGRFDDAVALLDSSGAASIDPGLSDDIRRAATLFHGRNNHGPPSITALEILLEKAIERRHAHAPIGQPGSPGGIVLIGGTLGGGGAERQLANTALGIQQRSNAGEYPIGPISIFCRKLDRRRANDFYLPRLESAGIRVADYLSAPPWGGDRTASCVGEYDTLIALLPPRMREGVVRLTDILRYEAPDVVQIWQDGMIFSAGLAALLANVPRIVLNVRTMPPSTRTDRQKPEQEALYRGMLSAGGVSLMANSRIAARAYETWLGLPRDSVFTVANGVEPLSIEAPDEERARWGMFDAQTGHHGFILGGVMRLDANKRPMLWLEICKALSSSLPDARFILAGHGPLRTAAEEFARTQNILERTLFVGRTAHVGYWLGKMNALALTSRHEGVPNALIEAQLAGIPVVTTPAGGAAEAVAANPANLVLADAELPDAEIAANHLAKLSGRDPGEEAGDAHGLHRWASDHFAMEHMIDRTLDIFTLG